MNKNQVIQSFIELALKNQRIQIEDVIYHRNQLLHFLGLTSFTEVEAISDLETQDLVSELLDIARGTGRLTDENFEGYQAALMDFICPLPSRLNQIFWEKYKTSAHQATDYFYQLAIEVDQVKQTAISKNIHFIYESSYADLEITINLSKPEKDPKVIASEKLLPASNYPSCVLCTENEGLYGGGKKAARSNHRLIRLSLNNEDWAFQYSPYAYYNEHSILLHKYHQPMKINQRTFKNLLDFLDIFPHYMIGSNADLPIVGGSILSHDHYQAGRHDFPMAKARNRKSFDLLGFPEVKSNIVDWPMSVFRLTSSDKSQLLAAANKIHEKWKLYNDESLEIRAKGMDGTEHHTITPIARKSGINYELDLVLRDNNVSDTYPDGIFHPHPNLHHIKKENIGLIEVMGLAILPARLEKELAEVEKFLLKEEHKMAAIHQAWAEDLAKTQEFTAENVREKLRQAVGSVFLQVLEDAGTFKNNKSGQISFQKFIDFINDSKA
ncbi:MAG: UDP-glucose--hexose-1-phosphate uridylyltransferase [Lactovum sp.]